MAKQKVTTTKRPVRSNHRKPKLAALHRRRAWWFTVLTSGLLLIQFAYNIHSNGSAQVLGYATNVSAETLFAHTNEYRTQASLKPLNLNDKLARAAQAKAEDMIARNYWSHAAPDGTSPWQFIQKADYNYSRAGENLAYGFTTSDQVVVAWINSGEHRDNIVGEYADVGFGFANGKDYQNGNNTVVVAMYGLPSSQKPSTAEPTSQPVQQTAASDAARHVNGASTIVSGSAPWATYASLALLGATIMGFIVTHMETLRLGWHNARRYAVLHPAVDAAILLTLGLVIVQAAGGFIQ